jgi:hypothetical protein
MIPRALSLHLGLLVISAAVASRAWLAEDESNEDPTVEIWGGNSDQVEKVEYSTADTKVVLEAKKDDVGRFFTALVERAKPKSPASPHSPQSEDSETDESDETEDSNKADAPDKADEEQPEVETLRFVAAAEANDLAEALAPLSAVRTLGKLDPARDEEFGFGDAGGKLVTTIAGTPHELLLGGRAPGGGHAYVRTPDGETFVIVGHVMRDLESAASRLMQRELHEWDDDEAHSVSITLDAGKRQLVRGDGGSWTSPGSSEKDESATNWMKKLRRLRISKYLEDGSSLQPLLKVEFASESGQPLGFTELASRPGSEEGETEFFARSELSRWWGSVVRSTAEQLAQDSAAIVAQ